MGDYGRGYRNNTYKDKPLIMQQVIMIDPRDYANGIPNAIFTCEDCRVRYAEISEAYLTYLNAAALIERHYVEAHVNARNSYVKSLRRYDVQELLQKSSDAIYLYLRRSYERGMLTRYEFLGAVTQRTRTRLRSKVGERAGAQMRLLPGSPMAYTRDPLLLACQHGLRGGCRKCLHCPHGSLGYCNQCLMPSSPKPLVKPRESKRSVFKHGVRGGS